MMVDLLSDFHLEMNVGWNTTSLYQEGDPIHYAWHKQAGSPVLVIAGDTANHIESTRDVIVEASKYYEHVVFVDGNHEHYSNYKDGKTVMVDMEWLNTQFNTKDRIVDNVTYLNGDTSYQIGDTLFIGANGWYNFMHSTGAHPKAQQQAWRNQSNDSVCIRFGKKNRPEKLARRQTNQLIALVENARFDESVKDIVVVTHTLPTEQAFVEYNNPSHPFFALNGAYCNNWMSEVLDADKAGKIKTWCFGHTHQRRDFFDKDGVHYVCNPRGYRGERNWHNPFNGIQTVDTNEVVTYSAFGEVGT
jgi:predicted phosphodiesterase